MVREWEHSARNLIYHFRCLVRGHLPFDKNSDVWGSNRKAGSELLSQLDDQSREFVEKMADLVTERSKSMLFSFSDGAILTHQQRKN
jgi:hypothetical protein